MNYSTASTNLMQTCTLADIERVCEALDEPVFTRREPIAEWMARQGFDPEQQNGRLVIPKSMQPQLGVLPIVWPWYVKFSEYVDAPVLIHDVCGLWPPHARPNWT